MTTYYDEWDTRYRFPHADKRMIQRLRSRALCVPFLLQQHELGCFVHEQTKPQQVIGEIAV
jgi:hypothetical protein